jgi:hypothetical protein
MTVMGGGLRAKRGQRVSLRILPDACPVVDNASRFTLSRQYKPSSTQIEEMLAKTEAPVKKQRLFACNKASTDAATTFITHGLRCLHFRHTESCGGG